MFSNLDEDADDVRSGERETSGRARILVADDDPDMCDLLVTFLTRKGYCVYDAHSGTELLRILRSTEIDAFPTDRVDLVIIDNRMPGLTGLEIIQKVRACQWETPFILMTGFVDDTLRARVQKLDAALLAKPFLFDALLEEVHTALDSRRPSTHQRLRIPS